MPSNEGRGYVLRRLLRRAVRHGRILGIEGKFMEKLSRVAIELSKDGYPELEEKQAMILKVISEEEDKFNKTIDQGMAILSELEGKMNADGRTVLSGEDAFKLYDTYGFPLDLTIEILEEKNFTVDEEGFKACMKEQREKARAARKTTNYMGADVTVYQSIDPSITTTFVGYDRLAVSYTHLDVYKRQEQAGPGAPPTRNSAALMEGDNGKVSYRARLDELDLQIQKIRSSETEATTYSMKTAAENELKLWDSELNNIYNDILNYLDEEQTRELVSAEREWMKERDAKAVEAAKNSAGGTLEGLEYTASLAESTRQRAYALADMYEQVAE